MESVASAFLASGTPPCPDAPAPSVRGSASLALSPGRLVSRLVREGFTPEAADGIAGTIMALDARLPGEHPVHPWSTRQVCGLEFERWLFTHGRLTR